MISLASATGSTGASLATDTPLGWVAIAVFCLAYLLVVAEDLVHLRKSKPVVLAAGAIWVVVALALGEQGHVGDRVKHHIADFAELFLFLMVAMTYVSAIAERNVFRWLNAWLVRSRSGLRTVFWATGFLAFFLSPIADNMTTALVMGAVVVTVGGRNKRFIATGCCNVVVAANAGGAFSPFGDITTLMVWQAGKVETIDFLAIYTPALISWVVPAAIMHFTLPDGRPEGDEEDVSLGRGWLAVSLLFLATIATAVVFHAVLHIPPFLGMMTGLGYFFLYGHVCRMADRKKGAAKPLDVFQNVAAVEWDTLLFFFGVIMCVGGLAELGYLSVASHTVYEGIGPFWANVVVGVLSAIVDNVPVMFAVLGMDPAMSIDMWLLVTLTAGIGGSLLAVGSAAGVALLGMSRGHYSFTSHLRWTPAIFLGYVAGIGAHVVLV